MINATVTGRLGKDAETTKAGTADLTKFSIASDQNNGKGKDKTTNWVECSIFGTRGLALAPYLKKGQPVTAIGEITSREHNGKNYQTLKVDHIELQGKPGGGGSGGSASKPEPVQNNQLPSDGENDDIPFACNVTCDINEKWWKW